MKTTTFLSLVAFSLLACTPRDPDVLSKDDKAFNDSRSKNGRNFDNKSNDGEPGRAKLPQKMDSSLGVMAEGRALQVQKILSLALKLSSSDKEIEKIDCVRAAREDSETSVRNFLLSFNDKCKSSTDSADLNLSGLADLSLHVSDKGELLDVKFSTHPLNESDASVLTTQVFSKATKDNLRIKESLSFSLERRAGTDDFQVKDYDSQAVMVSGYKETLTKTILSVLCSNMVLNEKELHKDSHFEITGESLNLSADNANPVSFKLILDGALNTEPSTYSFQMGKTLRTGKMIFSDSDVTVISTDSKREDKTSSPRKKSAALEGALIWDSWL